MFFSRKLLVAINTFSTDSAKANSHQVARMAKLYFYQDKSVFFSWPVVGWRPSRVNSTTQYLEFMLSSKSRLFRGLTQKNLDSFEIKSERCLCLSHLPKVFFFQKMLFPFFSLNITSTPCYLWFLLKCRIGLFRNFVMISSIFVMEKCRIFLFVLP